MTSLTGFEALVRERRVFCYGKPFYAGWGLTTDVVSTPVKRRGRTLSLDALVAAALILYPRYLSRSSGRFVEAEAALEHLFHQRELRTRMYWRRMLSMVGIMHH
jgi:capsular polysaccharide export protein